MLGTILLIILIVLLIGAVPRAGWPGEAWGYGPSGILGVVLVIVLILLLLGKI